MNVSTEHAIFGIQHPFDQTQFNVIQSRYNAIQTINWIVKWKWPMLI